MFVVIGCVLLDKFGFCNFGDLLSYLIIIFYFVTWRLCIRNGGVVAAVSGDD